MSRLAIPALLGHVVHVALASQSQIPTRVGDCVKATTELEFFYKDEGEYERTHHVSPGQHGVLLNVEEGHSNVEFLDPVTREAVVNGAVFNYQFARVPWKQGKLESGPDDKKACLTAHDDELGYGPVIRMASCEDPNSSRNKRKWTQQFSFNEGGCGARPIRSTDDPSQCVDAVHPDKILLTACSGADSQKFLFRCDGAGDCFIQAMGGRKDMCLFWETANHPQAADLQIRPCNFQSGGDAIHKFQQAPAALVKKLHRPNTAPQSGIPSGSQGLALR